MKRKSYWIVGIAAIVAAGAIGLGVVAAQETETPPAATGTATTQETPSTEATPPASDATPPTGDDERRGRPGGCGGAKFVAPDELAGFLGISVEELRTQLIAEGATLATVAEANGQSRDALKAFMTSEAETALAAKVADGTLTQAEADERLAQLTANLDDIIDGDGPGRGFHGRRMSPPDASSS